MAEEVVFDAEEIQKILPHRYPFILLDKVVEFANDKSIVAIKSVSANEPFFQGHFPGRPVMPGVLVLESMAQAGAILALKSTSGAAPGKLMVLASVDDVRWKRPVIPGDVLRIECDFVKKRGPLYRIASRALVDSSLVAQATIGAVEVD